MWNNTPLIDRRQFFDWAKTGLAGAAFSSLLLQDRLVNELGADYRETEPFTQHVEVDRTLYTGQNPGSAVPLAQEVLKALN